MKIICPECRKVLLYVGSGGTVIFGDGASIKCVDHPIEGILAEDYGTDRTTTPEETEQCT